MKKYFDSPKIKLWDSLDKKYKDEKKRISKRGYFFGSVLIVFFIITVCILANLNMNMKDNTFFVKEQNDAMKSIAETNKSIADTMKTVDQIIQNSETIVEIE